MSEKENQPPDNGAISRGEFYSRFQKLELESKQTQGSVQHIEHTLDGVVTAIEKLTDQVTTKLQTQDDKITNAITQANRVSWGPILTSLGLFATVMIYHTDLTQEPVKSRIVNLETEQSYIRNTRFTSDMGEALRKDLKEDLRYLQRRFDQHLESYHALAREK